MKIKSCLLFIIITVLGMCAHTFAADVQSVETIVQKESFLMAKEKEEVQKAIDRGGVTTILLQNKDQLNMEGLEGVENEDQLVYGNPYKVVVANKEMVNALLAGKDLSRIIPNLPYYWEVPILLKENPKQAIGSFTVDYYEGAWNVAEIGGYLPNTEILAASSNEEIVRSLKSNAIAEASLYTHIRIPSLKTDYFYANTQGQEYFMKVGSGTPEKTMVKQTSKELLVEIGEPLKTGLVAPEKSIGGAGAQTQGVKNQNGLLFTIAASTMVVILLSSLMLWRRLGSKQKILASGK